MKTIFRRLRKGGALLAALAAAPLLLAAPPQSVVITAPANNASFAVSSASPTISFTATATASTGSAAISQIDFRVNGVSIGTLVGGAASVNLTFPWQPTAIGTYTLTAIASDSSSATGNTLTSSPITVTVTSTRFATVLAPTANQALPSGSQIFLRSSAAMSDGVVQKVDFVLDPSGPATVIGTSTQAPYNVPYTVAASIGAHTLVARVTASDNVTTYDSVAIPFSVAAAVGTPPTVAVTAPTAGVSIPTGTAAAINASAASTNVGGFIQSVTFFVDGEPIGTDATAPYAASWTPTIAKAYSLRALATDDKGNTTLASAVTVNAVGSLPTISITAPTAGASLTTSTLVNVTATATASSAASAITNVTFFAGGVQIGAPATGAPPYSVAWTTPATAGSVALVAQVLDNAGLTATSSIVTVNVGTVAPTVALSSPTAGTVVGIGSTVPLIATATANGGATVQSVQFLVGGTLIGTATSAPYTINWIPAAPGAASLTARVTDSNNAVVTSAAVAVTVGTAPTVAITSPVGGTVSAGSAITIAANATAAVGAMVQSVQFLVNGTAIGTDTTAPYSASWTPTLNGPNVLSAQVTDSLGVTANSANVTVTVTGGTTALASVLTISGSTSIPAGSTRALSATASGGSGAYDRVELYYDTALVATDTSSPYTFLFTAPPAAGNHFLTARVVDANGLSAESNTIPISLTSAIGVPPVAAIVTPSSGSFLGTGVATTITGTATDADGTINLVQVFVNGVSIGNATLAGPAWSIAWTPSVTGTASITAIASDNSGNAVAAPAVGVSVTDNTSPAIALTLSPGVVANGLATLPSGATRNIVAGVTPSAGRAVVRVEFFIDGTKIGEDTTAPYTFRYTAPALATGETSRSFVLSARATDNAGAARDVLQPLLVVSPIGQPPTVTLITPANGANAVPNTAVSLAAAAVAPGGTIASVQFYVNGSPALVNGGNPIVAAPYTATFTPTAAGTYAIDAIATDDRGNTAFSAVATITAAFATPTIVFTAPNPNATARATPGVPLTLSATATVQTGTGASILLVEFLLDGVQIGADTTAPYSFSWIPTPAQLGQRVLTARVTDTNSQTATSPALTVNVANIVGSPPTVSVSASPIPGGFGLQTASTVNFLATAVATGGTTLANVEIFLNDLSIGLAAREQATNTYRIAYSFSRFDFTTVTPTINDLTGAVTYPVRLYAIARDNNNNQTVSATVNLVVNPATSSPPAIQIQALTPTNINVGTQFFMVANAADTDGVVTSIQLFANGQQVAAVGNPQQGALLTFTPNNAGSFNLYAVATDDTGNTAVSTPSIVVNVTAIAAPSTTLTRPSDDATVTTANAPVFLEGTAVNNATTQVPALQFVVTSSLGIRQQFAGIRVNANSTSYRAIWQPTVADTYTVTTQASVGIVQGTSPVTRRVVVNSIQGLAPSIALTRAPGVSGFPGTATTASTADLAATATDPDGSIVSVEFFLDRNSIGQARRDPQGNTWRLNAAFAGLQPGNTEIVALARDNAGNVVASNTGNINITAPSSIAPSITITPSTVSPAFNRAVQLRANARDSDGTVTNVQYFANATAIANSGNAGTLFLSTWTPTESGTYLLYAVATDNTGITRVSDTVEVNVRRNNPVLENAAFILQTYQDIANTTNINPLVFDQLDEQLGSGALTRADVIVTPLTANGGLPLTDLPGFQAPLNLLATYYVLMGQWPTPQNYANFLGLARNINLPAAVGAILTANEYFAKYGFVPTAGILDTPTSPNNAEAFLARLHVAAGLPPPQAVDRVRFRSNNTLSATLGRGYAVVGLNQALAEFITNTNSTNAALFDRARAAALFYQLARPPVTMTVDEITARIDALLRLPSRAAIADAVLRDQLYGFRFVTITRHPQSLTVAPRSGVLFSVEAQGAPPLSYQWLLNGAPVAGATNALLSLTNVSAANAGTYTVAITSSAATATSDRAVLTLSNTPTRLANISTRGTTTAAGADVLIGGFVVQGLNATQTRQMLIRIVGPTLAGPPFNLAGAVANPRLEVYAAGSQTPVLVNDDWGQQTGGQQQVTAIQQAVQRAGAFNFAGPASADAAVLATLPPGAYTVQAKTAGGTGLVLIEAYDVTLGAAAGPRAANVSTRGVVGTGANALIAGFVVNGAVSRRILIRGVGPTLAAFGVPGVLADPQITLTNQGSGQAIATNDNWASGPEAPIIAQAAAAAAAFPLANGSRDAALIVMLPPGAYTVTLTGVGNTTGIGIVEVYDVDP